MSQPTPYTKQKLILKDAVDKAKVTDEEHTT